MDAAFWRKYQSILLKHKIPSGSAEWYTRWVKSFEKALPDVPLHLRTREDVQAYLDSLVRRNRYQDWQLSQVNEALRILFGECFVVSWARPWPIFVNREGDIGNKDGTFQDDPNWDGVEIRIPGVFDRVRTVLRTLHYAYRTEQSYIEWVCRFLNFGGLNDPHDLGPEKVREYLEYLATLRGVSASTQRQALNVIVFLYDKVLGRSLGDIGPYERPKRPQRLPVVLTRNETERGLVEQAGDRGEKPGRYTV